MTLFEFRISPADGDPESRVIPCEDFDAASHLATRLSADAGAVEVQVWSDGTCRARFYPASVAPAPTGEVERSFAPSQAAPLSEADTDAIALWTAVFGQAPPVGGPAALLLSIMARHAPPRAVAAAGGVEIPARH